MPETRALLIVWPNAMQAQGLVSHLAKIGVQCEIRDYGDVRAEDSDRDKLVATDVIPPDCLQALRLWAMLGNVDAVAKELCVSHSTAEARLREAQEALHASNRREAVLVAARMGVL